MHILHLLRVFLIDLSTFLHNRDTKRTCITGGWVRPNRNGSIGGNVLHTEVALLISPTGVSVNFSSLKALALTEHWNAMRLREEAFDVVVGFVDVVKVGHVSNMTPQLQYQHNDEK